MHLPAGYATLVPVIIRQVEKDAATPKPVQ
jgi:hypothetical protein